MHKKRWKEQMMGHVDELRRCNPSYSVVLPQLQGLKILSSVEVLIIVSEVTNLLVCKNSSETHSAQTAYLGALV